ncbi:MAG: FapA family protein [Candidatus Cloacimonadaceae bacterium]|nr:FapA family protein [Candidatus Cloacimonadaceae bacterium]
MTDIFTNKHGNLVLEIKEDRMSAWLRVKCSGRLIDEREIIELIDSTGIKTGFDEALKYCRTHGLEKDFDTPFPVAVCTAAQSNAKLNYFFDTKIAHEFNGSIRPCDLKFLTCIEADTVLADYSSNIFDRQGSIYNIFGEMIEDANAELDKEQTLAGENVFYDASRRRYVAEKTGYPHIGEEGAICIIDNLVIEGDLEEEDAKLRTPVSVCIRGNVHGADIAVRGGIKIEGDLSQSRVYCEGTLEVSGDVKSCDNPGIEVLGKISCRGIYNSRVRCLSSLNFTTEAQNCMLVAETGINSENEPAGGIVGGQIQTCGSVFINSAGSADGEETEIEITISPFYKALLMQLTKELISLKQDPEDNADLIQSLGEKIKRCEGELDGRLNTFLKRSRSEKLCIKIAGDVFPLLRLRVLKHDYQIRAYQKSLEILERD